MMGDTKDPVKYSDDKKKAHAPLFDAPPPAYSDIRTSNLLQGTAKIPPTINGYFRWMALSSTFVLGPSKNEKLFFVNTHNMSFKNSKPTLVISDGPSKAHPVLATVKSNRWLRAKPVTITLPPRPGGNHKEDIVMEMSSINRFHLPVGHLDEPETFEWRSSHGKEIKELAGYTSGYKLVRMSERSGSYPQRKSRPSGVASDGGEIVAVIAHNASMSLSKGLRFAFLGHALSSGFGERWEIMALATALHLWYRDVQNAAASSAAAGAAA